MIGIGTDLIEIARIAKVIERHPQRFARRVLTDLELQRFIGHAQPAAYLAKRFAAKEAISKALGTGIGAVEFHDISVLNNPQGAPEVTLSGEAAKLLASKGGSTVWLSLSDERDYALAFAVLT